MELLERQETWNITYNHALGETASCFYTQDPRRGRDLRQALRQDRPRAGAAAGVFR